MKLLVVGAILGVAHGLAVLAPKLPPRQLSSYQAAPRCHACVAKIAAAPNGTLLSPVVVTSFFTYRVVGAIASATGVFTAAFVALERWHPADAFYFVVTTAATIGFGDMQPTRSISRFLVCLIGCGGVGVFGGLLGGLLGEWTRETPETVDETSSKPKQLLSALNLRWRWLSSTWTRVVLQTSVLLALGVLGLRVFERPAPPSWADAAYLIIGALTTAGLGDVVPVTRASKVFVGFYSIVGTLAFTRVVGAVALRPLEAARRAAQKAVLKRYGSKLTEESLEMLARGPLVKRLGLSADDSSCSRDEFTLLTLVEQGKISESDLAECRKAFDALDVTGEGRLDRDDLEALDLLRVVGLESTEPDGA